MHSAIRYVQVTAGILCGSVLAALLVTAPVLGQVAIENTSYLAFSGPVGLPGVVLPAGEYTFQAIRSDLVRVSSRDGTRVFYTGFTNRVPRPRALDPDVLVRLGENASDAAPPITEWYPQPTGHGHQFMYR